MEGVEEREGRGQRVRRKSSGFPGVGKQSSRGCAGQSAGQSTGQGEAGLQAPRRPRWGAGDHRLRLQGRKSPRGAEKNNEGADPAPPQQPSTSKRQTHSLIQPSLPEPAQPRPASWQDGEGRRAAASIQGGKLSQPGFRWASKDVKVSGGGTARGWGHPSGRLASVLGPEEPGGGTHLA